mgnify:CR=1 FL=1
MVYDVGIDVGSVSINCMVIDEHRQVVLETPYLRHFGLVYEETLSILKSVYSAPFIEHPNALRSISFTGVHGQMPAEILGAAHEVETIAQVVGAMHVVPGVRTIISMGGQDAALFQLTHFDGRWHLEAFNMNGPCASGTGSFIDQQAERLALSLYGPEFQMDQAKLQQTLDDFVSQGMQSTYPARVACRCTVFTKSDMIHLQNKGESLPNIIAGLHYGNAANYVSTIVGNRRLAEPIVFIGGMASNTLQVRAFQHYFPRIQVPPHHTSLGALGAALQAQEAGRRNRVDLSRLEQKGFGTEAQFPHGEKLELRLTRFEVDNSLLPWPNHGNGPPAAYLGVDIGSTSTKYALIDDAGNLLHKCYIPTRGKPIEVTQNLLRTLMEEVGDRVRLVALATTGSGRNVVGDFLSADLVIDEITAHARGAVAVDPSIDTIFEIGGQDSKYIHLEKTHPLDFDMNKVCAAGTGSFLHELANKMKINIVKEFQEIALASSRPVHLAERCTVFMESDLVGYAQKGARREDLIAGLCYAIVHNYLNRVVEKRPVGQRVMFLGGPSLNKGIVAAFEKVLGRAILVPRHREVMGAFVRAAEVLQNTFDCTVLIIHHTGWDAARERGHSSLRCNADTMISAAKVGEHLIDGIEISCIKQKDSDLFPKFAVRGTVVGQGDDSSVVLTEEFDLSAEAAAIAQEQKQQRADCMLARLIRLLPTEPNGMTPEVLAEQSKETALLCRKQLKRAYDDGLVLRVGQGVKHDPYSYWLTDEGQALIVKHDSEEWLVEHQKSA